MSGVSVAAGNALQAAAALANKPLPAVDNSQQDDSGDAAAAPVNQTKAALPKGVGVVVDKSC